MKAIIIDDTRLARQELRLLLDSFSEIEVVSEASNAEEAVIEIKKHNPDLLFLDIQMPGKDGFELLASLDDAPEVIFVTAYSEFAIRAFEYNALDYLQKPLSTERLRAALDKVIQKHDNKEPIIKDLLTQDSQVFVKDGEKCWFVNLGDISLFEIYDNYTKIHFKEYTPMIPKTLNYLETRLDPKVYFRANRQQIINTQWIDKVEPWFSGTIRIYLKDGTEVEVSRRQTVKFKEIMGF